MHFICLHCLHFSSAVYLLHFTKLFFHIKLCRRNPWWWILDTLWSTELHENFRRQIECLLKNSKVFEVVLVCRNLNSDLINIWLTRQKYEVQVLNFCHWVYSETLNFQGNSEDTSLEKAGGASKIVYKYFKCLIGLFCIYITVKIFRDSWKIMASSPRPNFAWHRVIKRHLASSVSTYNFFLFLILHCLPAVLCTLLKI